MTRALWVLLAAAFQDGSPDPEGLAFFESRIRPVLVERCAECHTPGPKMKGGLSVATRADLVQGGDTGPALVPGDPAKSLLLSALRWESKDLKMPPKKKLSETVIADFETWVKRGAPDPRTTSPAATKSRKGLSIEEGRAFWAYRAPVLPAVPEVAGAGTDIDRFHRAALAKAGLPAAPEASREVLLRRLSFDLTGLPPTPGEIDAFVADAAPDAWERRVDAMLASKAFAERWARHWLDVARYAESLTLRGFLLKEAWRYRDYVVDAFHRDLPYSEFVKEQIAGGLLPAEGLAERRRKLVAQGFLALGNTNLEEQDKKQLEMDVVDEQIEAIGKAFLGQTIGCARCHDHKFDPIPTKDYYAIAGILKNAKLIEHDNVSKLLEDPLPEEPAREEALRRHEEAVAALEARLKQEKGKAGLVARARAETAKGVIAVSEVAGIVVDDAKAEKVGDWKASTHSGVYIGEGYHHDQNAGKGERSLTFDPDLPAGRYEVRFAYSPGGSRATKVPVTVLHADGETTVHLNMQEVPPIEGRFVSLGQFRFENNQGYVRLSNEGTSGHVTADAVAFVPVSAGGGADPAKAGGDSVKALEAELKKLKETGPQRDRVPALREQKEIRDLRVHVRGSVHNLGETAPRGVLQVTLTSPAAPMPKDRSGRLELAEWLASAENPLTDRVWVNRVWHWLFGAGLVRTVDNFGTTGELPSHPELLDHLALTFRQDGGSLKKLVRRLVTTAAYRMASANPAKTGDADPDNRLLWKANRRRLDAEALRDAMLAIAGRLEPCAGGPTWPAGLASDYAYKHAAPLRSLYVPLFRNALPELFEVFDYPDPSTPTGRREASTVAPQALFMLNNPFVRAQAAAAASTLKSVPEAYRRVLGRAPTAGELAAAERRKPSMEALVHALFASVDFRYVR
jgi:hypothetical protein